MREGKRLQNRNGWEETKEREEGGGKKEEESAFTLFSWVVRKRKDSFLSLPNIFFPLKFGRHERMKRDYSAKKEVKEVIKFNFP